LNAEHVPQALSLDATVVPFGARSTRNVSPLHTASVAPLPAQVPADRRLPCASEMLQYE
jgi:hypothetical protein